MKLFTVFRNLKNLLKVNASTETLVAAEILIHHAALLTISVFHVSYMMPQKKLTLEPITYAETSRFNPSFVLETRVPASLIGCTRIVSNNGTGG